MTPRDLPLLGLLLKHQRQAWRRGEAIPVETYVAQQTELQANTEAILDLIYPEIVLPPASLSMLDSRLPPSQVFETTLPSPSVLVNTF